MDWNLLAGGLSQGLNNALTGANQGLVGGEQIRAGRAQEALAGQHLGMQQQQLQAHLQQQQIQNQLAREQLGLHRDQLQQSRDYHTGMLGLRGGELAVKQAEAARHAALLPYEVDYKKAGSEWMRARPGLMDDRTNAMRERTGVMDAHYADMADAALRRVGVMQGRLNVYAQRAATLSPGARLALEAIKLKARDLGQQLHNANYAAANGVPWKGPAIPELVGQMTALEEQAARLAQQHTAPQGGQLGQPPVQFDPRKYNLRPMVQPGG